MTFIRNFTHHPENIRNEAYSQAQLSQSILSMRKIVGEMRQT